MAQLTVVYWRDIPAQVIVKKGRESAKVQLNERFEKAIDRAAMKANLRDTDSYLAEWRRAAPVEVGDGVAEGSETLVLGIGNATGGPVIAGTDHVVLTITDSQARPPLTMPPMPCRFHQMKSPSVDRQPPFRQSATHW